MSSSRVSVDQEEEVETEQAGLPNLGRPSSDEPSPGDCCRFCLDAGVPGEELLSVCECRGSQKWVHGACLRRWQLSVQLSVNRPEDVASEERHRICGLCRTEFKGLPPLNRTTLLAELAGMRPDEIRPCLLLRHADDFPVPDVEPFLLILIEAKKAHFEHSVYLLTDIVHHGVGGSDDVIGVNLTRTVASRWTPSTSLTEQSQGAITDEEVAAWRQRGLSVEVGLGGPVRPRTLGPAVLLSPLERNGYVVGDAKILQERGLDAVQQGARDVQLRLFLGYAQWSREQLLGEVARGSWAIAGEAREADLPVAVRTRIWHVLEETGRLKWAPPNPMAQERQRRLQQIHR